MFIILGTHADRIHSIEFDEEATDLRLVDTLQLVGEQPAWLERSPSHPDIFYTNTWTLNKLFVVRFNSKNGSFELLQTKDSGGEGPTHFRVIDEGKGLAVAHYRSGTISYIPLDPTTGLFVDAPIPEKGIYALEYRAPEVTYSRQEAAHAHQILLHPTKSEVFFVDLGSDRVVIAEWKAEWVIKGSINVASGNGARHAVITPDGKHIHILNELRSSLSTFTLPETGSNTQHEHLSTISTIPKYLQDIPHGPYEILASSIALLPPVTPSGASVIVATNRDAPHHLTPEGDSIAIYSAKDGEVVFEDWINKGLGRHLRGMRASKDGRFMLVAARNTGEISIFKRVEAKLGLELLLTKKLDGVEKVVDCYFVE